MAWRFHPSTETHNAESLKLIRKIVLKHSWRRMSLQSKIHNSVLSLMGIGAVLYVSMAHF